RYLYEQLDQTLQWINTNKDYMIPVIMYELKMFKKGGFAPIVDYCVNCGRQELPYTFSIQEGGMLCPHCKGIDPYTKVLPNSFSKLLTLCLQVELNKVGSISVKDQNKQL